MTTSETADDVFTAAQIEHGLAIANLLLHPSSKANDEVKVTGRALGEAARFAAKNNYQSGLDALYPHGLPKCLQSKPTNEKKV
jgi:hypothetical protein